MKSTIAGACAALLIGAGAAHAGEDAMMTKSMASDHMMAGDHMMAKPKAGKMTHGKMAKGSMAKSKMAKGAMAHGASAMPNDPMATSAMSH